MSEVKTIENKDAKLNKKVESKKGLNELRIELQKLILNVRSGKEKNTSLVKKAKKDIARLLTNLKANNGK